MPFIRIAIHNYVSINLTWLFFYICHNIYYQTGSNNDYDYESCGIKDCFDDGDGLRSLYSIGFYYLVYQIFVPKWHSKASIIMMTSLNGNIFQRPVTRSFDVFFDLRPNKWLSKHWWGWWFEMSRPLWCHCNACSILAQVTPCNCLAAVSRYWWRLTSIGILIIKIRQCHNCLILVDISYIKVPSL